MKYPMKTMGKTDLNKEERTNLKFLVVIFLMSLVLFNFYIPPGIALPTNKKAPLTQGVIFDNSSVPLVDYGYINGTYIGLQRNPTTIAQTALHSYDLYQKSGSENARTSLINNANWLVRNAIPHGNYSIFEYKFPYPIYDMKPLWYSALAQGEGLKALISAYKATGEVKYLNTARMLLNAFYIDVKNGGITYKTRDLGWWYEEYASISGKQPRVLNGMLYALNGVFDYFNFTHDIIAKYIFYQGLNGVKSSLAYYDDNGFSYYDILGKPSPLQYHRVHIILLQRLYDLTKEPILKYYHDLWLQFLVHKGIKIDLKGEDVY